MIIGWLGKKWGSRHDLVGPNYCRFWVLKNRSGILIFSSDRLFFGFLEPCCVPIGMVNSNGYLQYIFLQRIKKSTVKILINAKCGI